MHNHAVMKSIYQQRRHRLAQQLQLGCAGVALIPNAPEHIRSGDSHYLYRFGSHFHYLCGFEEPHSWLVITSTGQCILFCRDLDPEREMWEGRRLGPQAAQQSLGFDLTYSSDSLDERMPALLGGHGAVWTLPGTLDRATQGQLDIWLGPAGGATLRDLTPMLGEMQLIKDDSELATMRQAACISAAGHARAMRFCAQHFRQSQAAPLHEYAVEAELLHEFRRRGAQSPAYSSIVAAGPNACVLHHQAGHSVLQAGQLCLIDAGCELDGYASDISRTFPADGRFTSAQRELYDIVLAAQEAAIAQTRPGARLKDAHYAAVRVLAQGMLDTGLLNADQHGSVDDVIASAAYRQFYMHGTGHWLGRDVHDVGDYLSVDEEPVLQADGLGGIVMKKPSRYLRPGMVVTVEPGLYVRPGAGVPERYWNLGLRIEDDAVITPEGCELISRDVPVCPHEIEAMMAACE
jgi:Xaa-Pro aminopeptidase